MKFNYIVLVLFISSLFSQVSLSDVREMSNDQLDLIKQELNNQNPQANNQNIILEDNNLSAVEVTAPTNELIDKNFFGYQYFQSDISFFDNVPVPQNFIFGPGDEVIISIWGETNFRKSFTVNREGLIYYEKIGFLNLSNKNLSEAQIYLKNEFSKIFSTLKGENGESNLLLEVGQLKSINIYFTGQVSKPGIHLIHPFSDLFSALVQAGGINSNGSLRNIKVFRNGKEIKSVDFYSFFLQGANNFNNLKLIDGDIIHVPTVSQRVEIKGEVLNTGFFELLENDTVFDLIKYAGGYTKNASQSAILNLIIPASKRLSDDNAMSSLNLNSDKYKSLNLNNGDSINILPISSVESMVQVLGRVKIPGQYSSNSSLKDVLDLAGGFNDPFFRQTIDKDKIVVMRKDPSNFYSKQFVLKYVDSEKFKLKPEDKILVYEDVNYRNSFTYRIEGEVNKPGVYPLVKGITVEDALRESGGLTEFSSVNNIVIKQEFTEIDEDNNSITTTSSVANVSLDFELSSNSVITALPFENVVKVEGNVYNPGLVAYSKGLTMTDAIIQAGGYKPFSIKRNSYVKKANGEVSKANLFLGRAKRLDPGDTVFVPVDSNPDEFDITTFIADLSTTLANIAAILLIVDNQSD
jgi:protein involved in polysaccharide export with SLBB domain